MGILYLLTAPEPAIAGTDAVYQEVATLQREFGGATLNLNPRERPGSPWPPRLFGLHNLLAIRQAERSCLVNHLYYSTPYYFPVLRVLRNPTVLTVVAGLKDRKPPGNLARLKSLHRIVVSNARDGDRLGSWGLTNYTIVPPGIEVSRLTASSLPMTGRVTLLMASAPWVADQFDLKGVDVLLDAAVHNKALDLILLWRGLLLDELRERIGARRIEDRVEVVADRVSIDDHSRKGRAT